MRKIILLIISLVLVCSFLMTSSATKSEYGCSDWAKNEIEKATLSNIANKEILTNFSQSITRYEFCVLAVNMYLALGKEMPEKLESPFLDTQNLNVSIAYTLGIVKGVTETEFAPNEPITREQMATMMGRLLRITGQSENLVDLKTFDDYAQISAWAFTDMQVMVSADIMKGNGNNKLLPKEHTSREQAIVMIWRLYEYLGGQKILLYEDTSHEILTELNIVSKEYLNSDKFISTYDFFVVLDKMRGNHSAKITNLSDWYIGDTLAVFDYLDDSKKALLLSMCYSGRNQILDYNEIASLNLDGEITNSEALLYILRMVGDTYGCTDNVIDTYTNDMNKTTLYEMAYEKGLITSKNVDRADLPVTYKELCDVLHKALFVEYNSGGYAGAQMGRIYDDLIKKDTTAENKDNHIETIEVEISIVATITPDLSIKWDIPKEYQFIADEEYFTDFTLITKDNQSKNFVSTSATKTEIAATDIIKWLVANGDFPCSTLRCTYSRFDKGTDYYFDIDISNIKLVFENEKINPGKYIRYNASWCAKEITLADGQNFEKGCYYVLKGYDKTYRKDEYNSIVFECFKAENTKNIFVAPTNRSFGVSNFDEIHIQKVEVKGNATDGFVLSATPESSNSFEVVESTVSN